MYPGFHEGRKLLQIQLIQAHVRDLSDLEDMHERLYVPRLKCENSCASREKFMQDLGFHMKDVSAVLVHNITDSYDSAKELPD